MSTTVANSGSSGVLADRQEREQPIEVLTLVRDGEEMLPAFSHEEEAEMFLRLLRGAGEAWRV